MSPAHLAETVGPEQIQEAVEATLERAAQFRHVWVRSIEGERRTDLDDFTEWRYCLGPYSDQRDRMIRLLASGARGGRGGSRSRPE